MTSEPLTTPKHKGPNPAWIYPIRSPVDWTYKGEVIVLEYPKDLNRFERTLNRMIRGPGTIKRPLDGVGTLLWELSDGEHSLLEIYLSEQERFHESVEPVDKVVGGLLEMMLKLGLLRLEFNPGGKDADKKPHGKRIVTRAFKK